MICPACKQELHKIGENTDYIAYGCDNHECQLFAHPQHYEAKNPEATIIKAWRIAPWRDQRAPTPQKENYQLLRKLGVPSSEAMKMKSNKRTQLYLEQHECKTN